MNKTVKALLYNFLGFAPLFILFLYVIDEFTGLSGFWVPLTAAVVSTIIAPKFQAVRLKGEQRIFMKWIFISGVKEVK
ncbi:hypothetical protein [Flavobacterium rhizosphaerae]|uniref:Uncharacterized protein n=1 Tax=Flavobacterium rhizosphaerae TaxID=3163298 RepID=A0ABW8YUY7_9FLAO